LKKLKCKTVQKAYSEIYDLVKFLRNHPDFPWR